MSKESSLKASINADQVEADAIRQGELPLAGCLTDDTIAYDHLPEEYDAATTQMGNAEWAENDDARETAEGDTRVEIGRRCDLLGNQYPFELSQDKSFLTYKPGRSSTGVYEFCLAFAVTSQNLSANPACQAVREFERLVGRLLKAYLNGDCAEYYRSGSPPDGDRPMAMPDVLADLHEKTNGEWRFSPPTGSVAQAVQGDDGIDVVVWKWFGPRDRRLGKPFLLAQCACGDDNSWFSKRNELNVLGFQAKWSGTISHAGALRCLATPRHVPHDSVWHEGTSDGGILLDRVRLSWMGEACLRADEQADCKAKLAAHTAILNQKRKLQINPASAAKGKHGRKKR